MAQTVFRDNVQIPWKITVSGINNAVGTANEKIVDLKLGNGNHSYKPEKKGEE